MPRHSNAEKARLEAYRRVLATEPGRELLDDLILFAQQTLDPTIRVGRADVVLRIMRELKRATESIEDPKESET